MDHLEKDLRDTLRPERPAPGFAGRVLDRIDREAQPRRTWWRAVAASLTLTALLGGWAAHVVAERREGERAREQVLLALKIAGEKVRYARAQVEAIGQSH